MESERIVKGIVSQGSPATSWRVKRFKVETSIDGITWESVDNGREFPAHNVDNKEKKHVFFRNESIRARYVRLHPTSYSGKPVISFAVYVEPRVENLLSVWPGERALLRCTVNAESANSTFGAWQYEWLANNVTIMGESTELLYLDNLQPETEVWIDPFGYDCDGYASMGWCDRGNIHARLGDMYDFPERNCKVCGRRTTAYSCRAHARDAIFWTAPIAERK